MEFRKSQTIYMQIADHICENVLSNKLTEGDRLQSVREMASNIQVNPNTVMRTYSYLQEKEIIFNKRGIGYFIALDALQKIKSMKKEEFLKNQLPEIFKMMDLLEITIEDIQKLYEERSLII